MLPFFGGYPDIFWTNAMTAQPASGQYVFGDAGKQGNAANGVPSGYPYLGVEIGGSRTPICTPIFTVMDKVALSVFLSGGMAADYNHRTHMFSEDMPSMHLVDVADTFNALGWVLFVFTLGRCCFFSSSLSVRSFYMYHGGNNPHSVLHVHDKDAPNTTLQAPSPPC